MLRGVKSRLYVDLNIFNKWQAVRCYQAKMHPLDQTPSEDQHHHHQTKSAKERYTSER